MGHYVFLETGTNLGNRLENLHKAVVALREITEIDQLSSIYETVPWGFQDQPAFLNQVISGTTSLAPFELLDSLKMIEKMIGRIPTFRYGPRVIDIDILFYDDLILEDENLTIPHPNLTERAFVLAPLDEIAPNLIHPVSKLTIHEIISGMNMEGVTIFQESTEKEK